MLRRCRNELQRTEAELHQDPCEGNIAPPHSPDVVACGRGVKAVTHFTYLYRPSSSELQVVCKRLFLLLSSQQPCEVAEK